MRKKREEEWLLIACGEKWGKGKWGASPSVNTTAGPRSTRFPTPRESHQLATTKVYPVTLFRRAKPTDPYFALALTEAEARLALAGYRLGESLNATLR